LKKAACFFPRRFIKHGRRTPMGIKAALPVTTVAGKSKIGISPGAMSPASAYSGHRVHEAAAVPQVSVPPPFRTGRTHALLPARHGVYRQKAKGSSLNRLAPGYFHRAGASVAVSYQHDRQPGISPSQLFQLHRYFSAPVKKHAAAASVPVVISRCVRHTRQKTGKSFLHTAQTTRKHVPETADEHSQIPGNVFAGEPIQRPLKMHDGPHDGEITSISKPVRRSGLIKPENCPNVVVCK